MNTLKKVLTICIACIILSWVTLSNNVSAAMKDIDYDVLKHQTQDVSIANDYFNKPAKLVDKNGKQYIQITVNHSHWIVNFTFNGHNETIVNEDKAKDERTSEFPVDQTSGQVAGTIKVFIDEEVNGKPFKYDHNYNITYLLKGSAAASTNTTSKDGHSETNSEQGTKESQTQNDSKEKSSPVNPQTGAGESMWLYVALVGGISLLALTVMIRKQTKQGRD